MVVLPCIVVEASLSCGGQVFKRADWTLVSDIHLDLLFMAGLQRGLVQQMKLACFLFAHTDCIYVLPSG